MDRLSGTVLDQCHSVVLVHVRVGQDAHHVGCLVGLLLAGAVAVAGLNCHYLLIRMLVSRLLTSVRVSSDNLAGRLVQVLAHAHIELGLL